MTEDEIKALEDRITQRVIAEIFAQLKLSPPEAIPSDDDDLDACKAQANRRSE